MEPGLSIIVPVFNGAETLKRLYEVLIPVLDRFEGELILVNDGSRDNSLAIMKQLKKSDNRIMILSFLENRGQQAALFSALRHCKAPFIATMDDDLQHPQNLLDEMITYCQGDHDLIYAVPGADDRSLLHRTGTKLIRLTFSLLTAKPFHIKTGSYRVFKKELISEIALTNPVFPYLTALMYKRNRQMKAAHIFYEPQSKDESPSRYTPFKLLTIYLKLFLHFGPLSSLAKWFSVDADYTHDEVIL